MTKLIVLTPVWQLRRLGVLALTVALVLLMRSGGAPRFSTHARRDVAQGAHPTAPGTSPSLRIGARR